jgi:hypothetical protein
LLLGLASANTKPARSNHSNTNQMAARAAMPIRSQ